MGIISSIGNGITLLVARKISKHRDRLSVTFVCYETGVNTTKETNIGDC